MKKFLAISALLVSQFAHADWSPVVDSYNYTATVFYGGGATSFTETRLPRTAAGPLAKLSGQFLSVPYQLQSGLNTYMSQVAASKGITFLGGSLTGDLDITIQPSSAGYMQMTMRGLSYTARNKYQGKKWGIISYECVNTLTLNNVVATAQYGASNGAIANNTGLTADVSSSTDCDSNISWLLPIVFDFVVNKVTDKIDASIVAGINNGMSQVKDSLFFGRDQDFLAGLNRLVPEDKVVTLPNGSTFAIGQYVRNNLDYLNRNNVNIKLGKGAVVQPVYGQTEPRFYSFSGDVVTLTFNTPSISFGVKLSERDDVSWNWKCSIRDPFRQCNIP